MADPSNFQAAYEEADITPPLGGFMPGYFRERQATGVLDPLKAKVLVLRQKEESIALVACDLVALQASVVARIREAVSQKAKPAPRHVWVHCTHTHTGGMVPRAGEFTSDAETFFPNFYFGKVDEKWVGQLVEKTADAVARAAGKLAEEKKLSLHLGQEKTLAHYRRYVMKDGSVRTNPGRNNPNVVRPAGEIDPRIHVLRFATNRILLVIYGMHPDCVGGTQYSADYPYHMAETLRHSLGAEWQVIFFNACCGNINHINVNDPKQKSGPEESRRLGQALALAVLEALRKEQRLTVDRFVAKSKPVACKLRKPAAEDIKRAEELLRTAKNPFAAFNDLQAPAALILAKTKDRTHQAEIAALRLGSFALATMPGEIFVELGREVEEGSPFKPTRTIGLTNGSMGYIPIRRAYAEGGYEAGYRSARYEPVNGHNWAQAAVALLKELAD